MNSQLSSRDQEQVSAYLDGALSERDFAQFKTRLNAESELAAAVKNMQHTRAALRRAPQRRVPRSFAVTQQMLGSSRPSLFSSWTSLNFASAAATLLLVFVLIGDFSTNGFPVSGAADTAAPQTLMAEAPTEEAGGATPSVDPFAQADRQVKDEQAAIDWNNLFAQYSRELEIGLGGIAIISGLLAWRQKQKHS